MTRLPSLAAALACLLVTSVPSAAPDKEDWAYGLIPAFRAGSHAMTVTPPSGPNESFKGTHIGFDVTALAVVPGDRFSIGANLGFFNADGTSSRDYTFGYQGFSLGAVAMVGLHPRFFLQARLDRLAVSDTNGEELQSPYRYGGGLTFVGYRGPQVDVALQLDVLHTSAKAIAGDQTSEVSGTTIAGGLQFSFFADE